MSYQALVVGCFLTKEDAMKKVLSIALLGILVLGSLGCMRNTFDYPNRSSDGREIEERRAFLIAGLVDRNDGPVVAHRLCNGPVKSVETVHTLGNFCVSCITLQIYTPNTVRVTCASGAAHNFYLDEDDLIVGHEAFDESGDMVEANFSSDLI